MSKNYQINYSIKASDLTKQDVDKAISNLKKLAEAQKKFDKERILSKQAVLSQVNSKKQAVKEALNNKKSNDLYLARHKQLLSRKSYMDKIRSLKMLKGDEDALKKYISNTEKKIREKRSKVFGPDEHRKKYENMLKELSLMNVRNRAETMLGSAIAANNRKREKSLELQRRLAERRRDATIAAGAVATAGLYAGARGSGYAFSQAMTLEQLGISMRAQYGVEGGNKVMQEMKDYARDTAFTLKEATQLLLGVKIGAENIGVRGTENQVGFTKEIGKAILAYGGNIEDRYEIGHQLSQIFMAGSANERQDLKVLLRRGLPIYTALQAMTGMNVKQLKDKYGAELPADLIAKAMLFMVKSPQVMRAWSEREESFVQAWESTTEQFSYTAGALGDRLAKFAGLPQALRSATRSLASAEDFILGTGKNEEPDWLGYASSIGFLTLSVFSLRGGLALLVKTFKHFGGMALAAKLGFSGWGTAAILLAKSLGRAFGWASALYLVFSDWSNTFEKINNQGLKSLLTDLDKMVSIIGTLGAGYLAGGPIGLLVAGVGLAGLAVYKGFKEADKNMDYSRSLDLKSTDKWNKIKAKYQDRSGAIGPMIGTGITKRSELDQYLRPETKVEVNNYIDANTGESRTQTIVKSPYDNPAISEVFNNRNKYAY